MKFGSNIGPSLSSVQTNVYFVKLEIWDLQNSSSQCPNYEKRKKKWLSGDDCPTNNQIATFLVVHQNFWLSFICHNLKQLFMTSEVE